ncbi:MAG TPA: ankyrin repeat domain-containing protein [Fimbriimonadaceae bacterium]|nr:ankyrin repeat domain-containing protein [Fimbriimonadaceae bacterium]
MSEKLPDRPNLDHLREQAKDLLRACRQGDTQATRRLSQFSSPPFALSVAQLAIARDYGFAGWPKLVEEVERILAREGITEAIADRFVATCLSDRIEAIHRLVEQYPALPEYNAATRLVAAKSVEGIAPLEAMGPEGWKPLEYVCYSHIHLAFPDRYGRQLDLARALLDAGADPNTSHPFGGAALSVLYGACCEARHLDVVRLLLERGANPNDGESVYHAAQQNRRDILELLKQAGANLSAVDPHWGNSPLYFLCGHRPSDPGARTAMLGVRWLLENGADPNVPCTSNGETPLHALCLRAWGRVALGPLVAHGANIDAKRADERTPYALAALTGSAEAAGYLREIGADTTLTESDAKMAQIVQGSSYPLNDLAYNPQVGALFVKQGELGHAGALESMLASGVPVGITGEAGATALHFAGFCGWADAAAMLLKKGAPIDVRDSDYNATPLGWTLYGYAENRNEAGDYVRIARLLLEAGADRKELEAYLDDHEEALPEWVTLLG